MRNILSPSFTSSKMRLMYNLIKKVADNFNDYLINKNQQTIEMEIKDLFMRFSNDVIASTAFAVEVNSLEDRNNEFFLMGKTVTNFTSLISFLKLIGYVLIPKILKVKK